LANLGELDSHGVRFIATTQWLDTDNRNPASRFLLHVLGAAAEFERELIRERSKAGRARYLQDFLAGRVGKTVSSRSGKNLARRIVRRRSSIAKELLSFEHRGSACGRLVPS